MKLIRNIKFLWTLYWLALVFVIWIVAFVLSFLILDYEIINLDTFNVFLKALLLDKWLPYTWSLVGLAIVVVLTWFIGASFTLSIKKKISNGYKFPWTYWFFWQFSIFRIGKLVKTNKMILYEKTNKRISKIAIANNREEPIIDNSYGQVDNKKTLTEERQYEDIEKEIAKKNGYNKIMDTEKIKLKSPKQEEFSKHVENKEHNIDNASVQQTQYSQYTTPFGQPVMYTQPIQTYTLQGPQLQAPQYVTQTLQQPGSQIIGTTQRFVPVQDRQQNQIQPQMPNVDYTSVVDTSSIGHGQFPPQISSNSSIQKTQHAFELSGENLSASALEKLRTLNFILENGGISYQEYYEKKKSIYMTEFDQDK